MSLPVSFPTKPLLAAHLCLVTHLPYVRRELGETGERGGRAAGDWAQSCEREMPRPGEERSRSLVRPSPATRRSMVRKCVEPPLLEPSLSSYITR